MFSFQSKLQAKIKAKFITYNVGDKSAEDVAPSSMFDFVKAKEFDFIFIGLQEVVNDASWSSLIIRVFGEHDYVLFKSRNIWAIWIYGLVKRSLLPDLDCVESEVTASGYAGVLGNKGGVTIRLKYHSINLAVVNAHFTAHEECFKDRLNDYIDIIEHQNFRDKEVKNLLDHDFVFWMGDLNFRIENRSKEEIEQCIQKKQFDQLYQFDQLNKAMTVHGIFKDFNEGRIDFPPTFKYDDKSDVYDTSKKQRKPAWTDRILFMKHNDDINSALKLSILRYCCLSEERGSDHRPVTAEFQLGFKYMCKTQLPIEFYQPITGTWNGECDEQVHVRSFHSIVASHAQHMCPSNFKPDKWDWVALMPANWTELQGDIITYSYLPNISSLTNDNHSHDNWTSVEFPRKYLATIPPGTSLQLVYFSKKMNWIQGISSVFSSTTV